MRVVMVSDVYFPRINGVSTAIQTYRESLRAHGVEVLLVAPDYGHGGGEDWVSRVPARPVVPRVRSRRRLLRRKRLRRKNPLRLRPARKRARRRRASLEM